MDRATHQVAQGRVDQTMALQRPLTGEYRADHFSFEVHTVRTADMDVGIGQGSLDEAADLFGIHFDSEGHS